MLLNSNTKLKFVPAEFQYFNWLFKVSPCFPINSVKINVITEPDKFYNTLCNRFKNANKRIAMASLYIGTGILEKELLHATKLNILNNKSLIFKVLLDYQRGTRGEINSKTLLQDFVNDIPEQCKVFLYQTPRLQGSWSSAVPARYNELVALQHMKLYIADDCVILSGANCSNDYFVRRQDRYVEIHDPELADFYCELIDIISSYSKESTKDGVKCSKVIPKEQFVQEVHNEVENFILSWKEKQDKIISSSNESNADTWVFPLIQMGEYDIRQDEYTTKKILETAPLDSRLHLATGYFNLTEKYAETLLHQSKAKINLMMAHPNANGFLRASGPAGGIPHAYSLIAKQFWEKVLECNQTNRIGMLEYERPSWTFHAKGLWYCPPGSELPWATVVGSANMGERSVHRDLEAQAAILTTSTQLQNQFQTEYSQLEQYTTECGDQLLQRQVPLWVRATVGLFRTFF